jgi:hypothetical protein
MSFIPSLLGVNAEGKTNLQSVSTHCESSETQALFFEVQILGSALQNIESVLTHISSKK